METMVHQQVFTRASDTNNTKIQMAQEFWQNLEFYRFGIVAWTLAIVACFGGMGAGLFVDGSSQLEITMVAASTMATLLTILVVAPIRWVISVGITAILINALIMIF